MAAAKDKKLKFALESIERIRRHKSICTCYNMSETDRSNLVKELGEEIVIKGMNAQRKYSMIATIGKAIGIPVKEKPEIKIMELAKKVESEDKVLILDSAEMVGKSSVEFLEELNEKFSVPVVIISAHPRFIYLFHDWSLYKNKAIAEVDYTNNF